MIFDMGKNTDSYPWEPIVFTADDVGTAEGERKMQLMIHRARLAVAAESMKRILGIDIIREDVAE